VTARPHGATIAGDLSRGTILDEDGIRLAAGGIRR
jgi:hypothetical protein